MKPIQYIDRTSGTLQQETVLGDRSLRFAYETALGRSLWGFLFHSELPSVLMGKFYDSRLSRRMIPRLAELPGCHPDEAEMPPETYTSFNRFFSRKLAPEARSVNWDEASLTSPADGRLRLYPGLHPQDHIPIKGAERTLNDLCKEPLPDTTLTAAIIRLAPVDYHRFHFPCDCTMNQPPRIFPGKYHSVNPIAFLQAPNLYAENTRQLSRLDTVRFQEIRMIEVGAFGVGTIRQTATTGFHHKMEEKGYFQFGGSTIILLVHDNAVRFDRDLQEASAQGLETLVRCGSQIAVSQV